MRRLAIVIVMGLMGGWIGCSGTNTSSTPTSLTPEEQRLMDEAQKKAADEERAQPSGGY